MIYGPQPAHMPPYDIRIWQCTNFGRHWHGSTEIYICLQGMMKIEIEGTIYTLHENDTVFVAGNEAHEIFCDTQDTRVVLISFGYGLLGSDYRRLQEISIDIPFFDLYDVSIPQSLAQPLIWIRDTLCKPSADIPADWILRSSLYAIAAYILSHRQTKPASAERQLRARQLEKMYGTLQYIADHYREAITVEQAAAAAGYDRSYFCKQFRKTTGMTFHRYLNYYRICAACHLLEDAKLPMSVVAEQSGFSSQKNLSRLFSQLLGMTPTQYRGASPDRRNSVRPL
ncbi:MAG: AraC family transcriptional regulator [Oscillospiraceae bacterium]|nr:AraC family transcriptional regulator [Oscillospiraceae bacterium]